MAKLWIYGVLSGFIAGLITLALNPVWIYLDATIAYFAWYMIAASIVFLVIAALLKVIKRYYAIAILLSLLAFAWLIVFIPYVAPTLTVSIL